MLPSKSEMTSNIYFDEPKEVSESLTFDLLITSLVGLNVLWMAAQLQMHGWKARIDLWRGVSEGFSCSLA